MAAGTLDVVSPLATLQRGYSIVTNDAGAVVTEAAALKPGDVLHARLARGVVHARVDRSEPGGDAD